MVRVVLDTLELREHPHKLKNQATPPRVAKYGRHSQGIRVVVCVVANQANIPEASVLGAPGALASGAAGRAHFVHPSHRPCKQNRATHLRRLLLGLLREPTSHGLLAPKQNRAAHLRRNLHHRTTSKGRPDGGGWARTLFTSLCARTTNNPIPMQKKPKTKTYVLPFRMTGLTL